MRQEPVVALVVAAGSGVRLGGGTPKALRMVAGQPLVGLAVAGLLEAEVDRVVVVAPTGYEAEFATLLSVYPGDRWRIVTGGTDRAESVRHGLAAVASDPELVTARVLLVHDAARPLVPVAVTTRVIEAVTAGAVAVIPVVAVADTVRVLAADGSSSVLDRSRLRAVQTPQGFDRATLLEAHAQAARDGIVLTDDAMACEHAGHPVTLVAGARESHKITEPADLAWAEAVLAARVP